jgi:RNA polymerase sigma-70 factor, ECF subfamily
MRRASRTPAQDQGGSAASVSPLFSRSSRTPDFMDPHGRRERTLTAIQRARRGDADALASLYSDYAPGVYAYVRRMLRNDYDAQDVTQQAFVKLATSLDKYDARRADFSAWMLRMAHNIAVDHLRKQRLMLMRDPLEATGEAQQPDPHDGRSLREAFRALSSAQRDVLLLRDVVGLTPQEVAKRLGKSKAAVNTCHHRARRAAVRSLVALGSTPTTRSTAPRRAA